MFRYVVAFLHQKLLGKKIHLYFPKIPGFTLSFRANKNASRFTIPHLYIIFKNHAPKNQFIPIGQAFSPLFINIIILPLKSSIFKYIYLTHYILYVHIYLLNIC